MVMGMRMAKCDKCVYYPLCVKLRKPALYGIDTESGCVSYFEEVRCKDCRHWHYSTTLGFHYCMYTMMGRATKPDDFCSYGERKDND